MIVDGTALPDGSGLHTAVVVVGAGPVGIVAALELAGAGHDVILLESGGTAFDHETQDLGESVGGDRHHAPMSRATRREIGGASKLWGGRCVPFDPIDFERAVLSGDGEWPVTYDEMQGFFQRACDWCVCGDAEFDSRAVPGLADRDLLPGLPEGDVRTTSLERWSLPTRFGSQYRKALENSPNVRLMTGLTCTEVICRVSGPGVEHLTARALDGHRVTISAQKYVLACGGLETTRLLLASKRRHADGIGNHSGHLGRWYMAHVESRIARARFNTPASTTIYGHERDPSGVHVRRRFSFTQECLTANELPNGVLWLANPEIGDPAHRSGVLSFVYLMLVSPLGRYFIADAIRESHTKTTRPTSKLAHIKNVVSQLGSTGSFALTFLYQRYLRRGRKVPAFYTPSAENVYSLVYHAEHLPHPDSAVWLSSQKDRLGMPRLQTRLEFSDADVAAVLRAHALLDDYLRRHDYGRLEYVDDDLESSVRSQLFGGFHQAGTTRMSRHPDDGVVDENLAVHGFDDLFVASSSTFVTSSQANSTFMVVAFALRLVDYLNEGLHRETAAAEGA